MFEILVPGREYFDEKTNKFVNYEDQVLQLEHSLFTIARWESKWEIPFLSKEPKTREQVFDYIKMMTKNEVPEDTYFRLTQANFESVSELIDSKQSATWFADESKKQIAGRSAEIVTSELIYYWMVAFQIPFECQHWHLYRLLTLIRVCNAKLNTDKNKNKRSKSDIAEERRRLNAARKKQYGTTG